MPYPEPNKICRVYLVDGQMVRADGLPFDLCRIYIREDPVGSGECWLYDGPFPDSLVTPPPAEES